MRIGSGTMKEDSHISVEGQSAMGYSCDDMLSDFKEELTIIYDYVRDFIVLTDLTGTIIRVNRRMLDVSGFDMEEVVGKRFSRLKIFPRQSLPKILSAFSKVIAGCTVAPYEVVAYTRAGEKKFLEINSTLFKRKGQVAGVITIARDITDRKRFEEYAIKAARLDSSARVAEGISHDFSNLIRIILDSLSSVKRDLDPNTGLLNYLMQAERAAREAKSLIRNLIEFSRGGAPVVKKSSIVELIQETVKHVHAGHEYRYEYSFSDNLSPVEIDTGQIRQALTNIILNAMNAMPWGGVIHIGAEEIHIGPESNVRVREGSYIRISIRDHGGGIPEDIILKIFDPYFHTKQFGEGRGFGLTTSYSIVKNHFGDITVESDPGKGTTFHIYLPVIREHEVRQRIPLSVDIVFGLTNVENEDEPVKESKGKLVDISSGGVGLLASSSLQEGQEVTIRFNNGSITPIHGKVKWVKRIRGRYMAGIEEGQ